MEFTNLPVKGLYGLAIRETSIHFTFDSIDFSSAVAQFRMKGFTIGYLFKDADIAEAKQEWEKFNENN